MNGPRRRLLAVSGSVVASLAGCLGAFADDPPAGASGTTGTESIPTTDGESASATDREPTETTGSREYPATVEVTTTVEREEVEYVAANDTVRYVAAYGSKDPEGDDETPPEREPIYETIPFAEWAETECASVGSKRVQEAMNERLDGETEGISAGVTREDGEPVVFVAHQTMSDRDGGVISEPTVSYDRVKRLAPERVAVTLTLDGRTRSCTVPVTTRAEEIRQQ